ncbi:MAG TPA: cytochrome C oxidase subunit IV family protein, partial [Candidatus Paenibacillus intestinavium]|nr:cytochrome C oxidase subunit IV family protein [Candidatus Paenibacillus intestinavium]
TFTSFALVMAGEMNTDFVYILLVGLAIIQVFIQMAFWMHMKDRGHMFAIIAILTGVVVVFTCVIMALYWTRW